MSGLLFEIVWDLLAFWQIQSVFCVRKLSGCDDFLLCWRFDKFRDLFYTLFKH